MRLSLRQLFIALTWIALVLGAFILMVKFGDQFARP
jgi:hypothetical protein